MSKKQLKNKEFIDYIVNDQCKELISEFVKTLKEMKNELGTDYFDPYIDEYEVMLK